MLLIRVVAIFSCRNPGTRGQRYFRAADIDESTVNEYVPIEIQEELYEYIRHLVYHQVL